jgi:superfamily II DNA or RNA helicase
MGARDLERAKNELAYFDRVWRDRYPTLSVREFPAVARRELEASADPDWEGTVERITDDGPGARSEDPRGRTLRPHQAAGLASWRANDRQGILCFATGAGKTFTAISAIREAITDHENPVVVVVPDQVLFGQWFRELEETLADLDVRILRAGAGHTRWRESLQLWTAPGEKARLTLATVQTARTDDFRRRLGGGPHLLLVADEVHRLGSRENRKLLDETLFGPRLGLSATPERAGDPDGTSALVTYFRGILEPRYTLADAVNDGVLTKYFYRPHAVPMSAEEVEEWQTITLEISRLYARSRSDDAPSHIDERMKRLLLKRARVVKHASAKVPLAVRVFEESYESGQRWIVYCENLDQLRKVRAALADAGFATMEFHSQMEGDRAQTLTWLDRRGGVVVAIKCLDEGVDVPSVTHALILASSKNPREFIQRRGRVLRRHPGKALAYVHDAIVVPPRVDGEDEQRRTDPIILGELARALEFAEHADNPSAAVDLQAAAIDARIAWHELAREGVEDEDD